MSYSQFRSEILKDIILTDETIIHLLRHFPDPENDFLEELSLRTNTGIVHLKELVLQSGSKYDASFARNPQKAFERIMLLLHETEYRYKWNGTKCEIQAIFSQNEYPAGIGKDNLITMENLTHDQHSNMHLIERDGFSVGSVEGEAPPTWQANLVLRRKMEDGKIEVVTLFPGTFAPPFPNSCEPNSKEYQESKVFWQEHVFLRTPGQLNRISQEQKEKMIIIDYSGIPDQKTIDCLIEKSKEQIAPLNVKTGIKKKVIHVLTEGIENILKHSCVSDISCKIKVSVGTISESGKEVNTFSVTFGNPVKNDSVEKLKEKIERANSLNKLDLQKWYEEIINNGEISDRGGAGLGIIDMALKSGEKLEYKIIPLSEAISYYELTVTIKTDT